MKLNIPPVPALNLNGSSLGRFSPEPKSSYSAFFNSAASTAKSLFAAAVPGVEGDFAALIQQQIYWQYQMQLVSMISNVEKSKHETAMAAVRNVRAG